MRTITETVRYWGVCSDSGHPPRSLIDFAREIDRAVAEIPQRYLDSAEIDFHPDHEYGEAYEAVRITYERPETLAEATKRAADERLRWLGQLADAKARQEVCERELAGLAGPF